MSTPSELRDKLLLSYGIGHGYTPEMLEEIYGDRVDYAMDAVIASLPEERIGTEKIPLNDIERGYNIAIQDVVRELQSTKSTSKESE